MFHVKHLCFLFNSVPKHMYGVFALTYPCAKPDRGEKKIVI